MASPTGPLTFINQTGHENKGTEIAVKVFMLAADKEIKEKVIMVSQEAKEIVGILMESDVYFELSLQERLSLIKRILSTSLSEPQRLA